MKYSIMGFNQSKLYENHINLNCNDLVVLRTLIDMIPMMDVKIKKDDKQYSWIMYKLLVNALPFITNSESTMKKIVQKLIDAGLIERLLINQGGKYTYFRKTSKCIELEQDTKTTNSRTSNLDTSRNEKIELVKDVLTEKMSEKIINIISKTDTHVLQKAVDSCKGKTKITNSYFMTAVQIASSNSNPTKNNLRFINFKSREYDYDRLEKKLLGWDDDTNDLKDYRQDI